MSRRLRCRRCGRWMIEVEDGVIVRTAFRCSSLRPMDGEYVSEVRCKCGQAHTPADPRALRFE